ncbi:hypothetical protein TNCV_2596151 [Trichonephila clavipes]|nr:hypothetical protein TNCV_2596151 [Trichonephila clavipes]
MRTRGDRDVYPIAPLTITPDHGPSRFVIDPTIEDTAAGVAASRVAAALFFKLRVHAAASVVELFVQTFVVLQTTPILDSRLVMWLHDLLRSYG